MTEFTNWPEEGEPEVQEPEPEDIFDWILTLGILAFAAHQAAVFFCADPRLAVAIAKMMVAIASVAIGNKLFSIP
jgi:hypothetical protein